MKKNVAINGFGRIGRLTFRRLLMNDNINVVAINDLTDTKTLAHLLKYDSIHGRFPGTVEADGNSLIVNGIRIEVSAERDPAKLAWAEKEAHVILESTGFFRDKDSASKHLTAGAEKVVISAPAKGDIRTIVLGVNDDMLSDEDQLVSNASCTTNCLAPMAKIINDKFGITQGYMTTIHAYTSDQRIQDAPHSDLRRARAAALSIIPTTTGAAKAVELVLPELKGKLSGSALRVPIPTGSLTDLTFVLKENITAEELNNEMQRAANNELKGIMEFTNDPIVSVDIVGNPHSCIFDSGLTEVTGNLARVVGWYDNEAGYSARAAELIDRVSIKAHA